MITKGRKKGTYRFAVKPAEAVRKVQVAGNFSNWQPIRMRKQGDGGFVAIVSLNPGTYEYKLIMDGEWAVDPDNNAWAMNEFGTLNSVTRV